MIWVLSILLFVSLVINVTTIVAIQKAMVKTESYDQFFAEMQTRITALINTMKEIDIRGSFQADDEIGAIFQQMQALVNSLDVFLLEPEDEDTNAKKK